MEPARRITRPKDPEQKSISLKRLTVTVVSSFALPQLADAADRAKRSLQEYTQLWERGASESELPYPLKHINYFNFSRLR